MIFPNAPRMICSRKHHRVSGASIRIFSKEKVFWHLFAALRILYFFRISTAQQQALVIFPCHRGCIIRDDFCLRVNFLQKFLDALFFLPPGMLLFWKQ